MAVAEKGMYGQKFNGGNAQPFQIAGYRFVGKTGKGAALVVGYLRMKFGKAAQMSFINDAFFHFMMRADFIIIAPVERIADDNRLRHIGRAVKFGKRQILIRAVDVITENRLVPNQLADQLFAVWVYQQLVGIKTVPFLRLIGAVNPIAVNLSGFQTGNINMPYAVVIFINGKALQFLRSGCVKQAELHLFGIGGEQCEINAFPVISRA